MANSLISMVPTRNRTHRTYRTRTGHHRTRPDTHRTRPDTTGHDRTRPDTHRTCRHFCHVFWSFLYFYFFHFSPIDCIFVAFVDHAIWMDHWPAPITAGLARRGCAYRHTRAHPRKPGHAGQRKLFCMWKYADVDVDAARENLPRIKGSQCTYQA